MSTLFVGAGAVGGFFGGRLAQAGKDVTFLVRERRARELAADGLRLQAPDGTIDRVVAEAVTAAELDRAYDLVVLTVKSFALREALDDIAPAVGPDTVVVPFLNGMRHLDLLDERYGANRVFGGVCYVATELRRDGIIAQLNDAQQSLRYGPASPDGRDAEAVHHRRAAEAVHEALSGGDFVSETSQTIVQDMWEKWTMLAAVGAATTLLRGDLGQINRTPGGGEVAARLVDEIVAIASGSGHAPRASALRRVHAVMSDATAPTTSSMYRDLVAGRPIEAEHIIGDLVNRGNDLGVHAPLLELARIGLGVYETARGDGDGADGSRA